MALLQLYSAQEDRHRAVLLAEFLNSLGTHCELITAEGTPAADPALVVWTAAASGTPWLADLFTQSANTVALVIDSVALPVRCERALDLSTWPARSADTQVAGLVSWLDSGHPSGDFGRAAVRKLQRSRGSDSVSAGARTSVDRTGLGALGVLAVVVALVVGIAMQEDGPESATQPQPVADRAGAASPSSVNSRLPLGEGSKGSGESGESGIKLGGENGGSPALQAVVEPQGIEGSSGQPSGDEDSTAETPLAVDPPQSGEKEIVPPPPVPPTPPPQVGGSSLAHLCRATSPGAALAWYGVLTRLQREEADRAACVRELLQRPGYEALKELVAQT